MASILSGSAPGVIWVVDVAGAGVFAFAVRDGGSKQIWESQVLPGLNLALVEEALK